MTRLPFRTDGMASAKALRDFVRPELDFLQPVFFLQTNLYDVEMTASNFGGSLYDIPTEKTMPIFLESEEEIQMFALSPDRSGVIVGHYNEDETWIIYVLKLAEAF